MEKSERIKVIVRCRPMNKKEIDNGYKNIVKLHPERGMIKLKRNKSNEPDKIFTFDAVYPPESKQQEIYDESFRPLIDSVLDGFNGTIFAYGQTGTGKTYTMEGDLNIPELKGVIPLSFEHIFTHIFSQSENENDSNKKYLVKASYLEIYKEDLRDLLISTSLNDNKSSNNNIYASNILKDSSILDTSANKVRKKLEIREKGTNENQGVYIKGLHSIITKNMEEIQNVMMLGNNNRTVGATNMNEHSSRSHAIFIITIECSENDADGKNHIRVGKLNLVDLAGSERQYKTGTSGERFKESTKINLSLCALGNVISAIVDGRNSHVPYRDSKLTRILQNSLGGNSKTIMVANIGPADFNYEETLMTLRYTNRAKNIKNKPVINEDPKDATLRKYQEEIERLKKILADKVRDSFKKKKKKGHQLANTELFSPPISSSSDPTDESRMAERMKMLERERMDVINDHNMIKEEKEKLLTRLEERENALYEEEMAQAKLIERIKEIESKLLGANLDIIKNPLSQQDKDLAEKRKQIAEEKRREREILQQLEAAEENTLETKETFQSLQQEIEIKTKKLKKLFNKLQSLNSERKDLKEMNDKEMQDLIRQQKEIVKESKFRLMVIENFVPPQIKVRFLKFSIYDENREEWLLVDDKSLDPKNLENNSLSKNKEFMDDVMSLSFFSDINKRLLRYDDEGIIKRPLSSRGYHYKSVLPNSIVRRELARVIRGKGQMSIENREKYLPFNTFPISSPLSGLIRPDPVRLEKPVNDINHPNQEENGATEKRSIENKPNNTHIVDVKLLMAMSNSIGDEKTRKNNDKNKNLPAVFRCQDTEEDNVNPKNLRQSKDIHGKKIKSKRIR
ncbi:kinesin-II 95 kDa subunit-like [Gordionus sp. m RMFG-2023]|uniref:kinesin-II 95 kDa subunit-like n=1 Tax=Gordionus sp. m RMFG-2023 TaxID=3053472 RepID=UPI0031FDD84B